MTSKKRKKKLMQKIPRRIFHGNSSHFRMPFFYRVIFNQFCINPLIYAFSPRSLSLSLSLSLTHSSPFRVFSFPREISPFSNKTIFFSLFQSSFLLFIFSLTTKIPKCPIFQVFLVFTETSRVDIFLEASPFQSKSFRPNVLPLLELEAHYKWVV